MTVTLAELPESRAQQSGSTDASSHTLLYTATGEQDDYTVHSYAIANVPSYVTRPTGVLYRKAIRITPVGFKVYEVAVEYGPPDRSSIPSNSYTFSFDTTGGTTNVKCAREHINSYPSVTTTPNHAGAIGVEQDGTVTGCDIVIPALKLTLEFKFASGYVTLAYVKALAAITGTTNSLSFLGFDAGELLFTGAAGSAGSATETNVTYNFIASSNATAITRGGITGIAKKGHEYAWEELGDNVDANGNGITKARAVHIERVYNSADFGAVFQWNLFTG